MRLNRSLAFFHTFALTTAIVCAQEAAEAPRARVETLPAWRAVVLHEQPNAIKAERTLWVSYFDTGGSFLDHRQYLADLQSRFRDQGVAVAVVLPQPAAEKLAAQKPGFVVATPQAEGSIEVGSEVIAQITQSTSGPVLVQANDLDLISDSLQQSLKGSIDAQSHREAADALGMLLTSVADASDYPKAEYAAMVERSLKDWPHSGASRACAVLYQWWCMGDLEAASKAVDDGIRALSNEAVPMTYFVDLVLRGDRNDPAIARKLAMAMAPVAAGASGGVFTQLVYLRALLRAGQDRVAGRVVAKLPKRLGGLATEQIFLAETLMEANNPMVFRDVAERAVQDAEANGAPRQWVYAARHKILKRCGDDKKAGELMVEYRIKNGAGNYNNEAWYLIVRPGTMGRFDTMALAQCEEMVRVEGDGIDDASLDTVALAYFANGNIVKALELQKAAAAASNNDPSYVGRLTRYAGTLKAIAKRDDAKTK